MLTQVLKRQNIASKKNSRSRSLWLIVSLYTVVLVLEFITPVDYVFGYLYTGPILLATSRLGRKATFYTTLIAVVTGILSDRNSIYSQALAQQQAKLQAQDQLTKIRSDFASTLTHDLKTPLLGAIETLKALEQGKFGAVTPTHYKVFTTMIRSHQSTLQLVETLLDVRPAGEQLRAITDVQNGTRTMTSSCSGAIA